MKTLNLDNLLQELPFSSFSCEDILSDALTRFDRKIIVLDDDPTGVQTVNGIPVYTSWDTGSINRGFLEEGMFFILTNSRGLSGPEAEKINRDIALEVLSASKTTGKDFVLISRSDSTLRGHYPAETAMLRDTLENNGYPEFNGEIICPFFIEGGRYTYNDIHYVCSGRELIPAGKTEFAKDKSFGYTSSNLREWVEEKTNGNFKKETIKSVSIETLRREGADSVKKLLLEAKSFEKIIVNAVSYNDLRLFLAGYIDAVNEGKHFIFRSAAAIPKLLGGVSDKPLLNKDQLRQNSKNGGLVVIGSHVERTTKQLEQLLKLSDIEPVEFNQHLVLDKEEFETERVRVQTILNRLIKDGKDVCLYTRRERLDMNTGNPDDELQLSRIISDSVTGFVKGLTVQPSYIISKGGITSSEIGTSGLSVKRAMVLGQVLPGVPVWHLGEESRFPGMAYIIFPGNVGEPDALASIVNLLKV